MTGPKSERKPLSFETDRSSDVPLHREISEDAVTVVGITAEISEGVVASEISEGPVVGTASGVVVGTASGVVVGTASGVVVGTTSESAIVGTTVSEGAVVGTTS